MYNSGMIEVSLTEARARLPELLTSAAAGEEIHILRHGRPVGVLLGHDRWVKTQQHDVLIQARELRRRRHEARGKPWPPSDFVPIIDSETAERWVRELREERDYDHWDHLDD
jgi:prevent-host-death family protein